MCDSLLEKYSNIDVKYNDYLEIYTEDIKTFSECIFQEDTTKMLNFYSNLRMYYPSKRFLNNLNDYLLGCAAGIEYICKGRNTKKADSLKDVLDFISSEMSLLFVGGSIRDTVLGIPPKDFDISFGTSIEKMSKLCKECEWPCPIKSSKYSYVLIGKEQSDCVYEPLEGKQWDWLLNPSATTSLDFTANSLMYSYKYGIILDLDGNGLNDVINSKIRIPIPEKYWGEWTDDIRRVLRYYKLREKDYEPINEDLKNFIITIIRHFWSIFEKPINPNSTVTYASDFFINKVLGGSFTDDGKVIPGPNKNKLRNILRLIREDLKDDSFFYDNISPQAAY